MNFQTKPVTRERRVKTTKYFPDKGVQKELSSFWRFKFVKLSAAAFFVACFFVLVSNAQAGYFAQGVMESGNILSGSTVTDINSFQVDAIVPASTTVGIKFSQDRVNYFDAAGGSESWTSCANGTTNIDLSGLGWSTGLLFYKLQLTTTDANVTPTVEQVELNYDGTDVPEFSGTTFFKEGILESKNVLSGAATVTAINGFLVTADIPAGTTASVKFSQDGVNFVSATGTSEEWTACANGANNISLSSLGWSGASLYYKTRLESKIDNAITASIGDVQVDYDGTAVPVSDGSTYPAQGAMISTDLFATTGMKFTGGEKFAYNISYLPFGSSVKAQFSQDNVNWYSSDGTLWGQDTLAVGSHLEVGNALDLSALAWTGATSFYYKLEYNNGVDKSFSPIVADAGLVKDTPQVFYSVGQNTLDHSTGANGATCSTTGTNCTISITVGTATFGAPQTATNLGVGDKVVAGANSYYISQKISQTQWKVVTKLGAVPNDLAQTALTSIAHTFSGLNNALTSASGAAYLNTTNLVAGNYQLNFPCYYDSGADTAGVEVSGYTTGASNFIKIYTPNNVSTEANQSQRHSGKWTADSYTLEVTGGNIQLDDGFVKVDGLQTYSTGTGNWIGGIGTGNAAGPDIDSDIWISNNIIRGNNPTGVNNSGTGFYCPNAAVTVYAWNNVVYDWGTGIGISGNYTTMYASNNTVYNTSIGMQLISVGLNNIVQQCSDVCFQVVTVSDNNISSDASSPNVALRNKTVSFLDVANKDFHLSPTDTAARNAGTNLQNDANLSFSQDIDGQERSGIWDIGADEAYETVVSEPVGQAIMNSPAASKGNTNGLVGYWSFDGQAISGTTAMDLSGNGNNGTIVGAVPTLGKIGQGLSFDGVDDSIALGSATTLSDITNAFTAATWIYLSGNQWSNSANFNIILKQMGGGAYTTYFNFWAKEFSVNNSTKFGFDCATNGGMNITSNASLPIGSWSYVAVVYDGTQLITYLNGVLDNQVNKTGNMTMADYIPVITGSGVSFMAPKIDELRVYNRSLSASEIGELFKLGQVEIRK